MDLSHILFQHIKTAKFGFSWWKSECVIVLMSAVVWPAGSLPYPVVCLLRVKENSNGKGSYHRYQINSVLISKFKQVVLNFLIQEPEFKNVVHVYLQHLTSSRCLFTYP